MTPMYRRWLDSLEDPDGRHFHFKQGEFFLPAIELIDLDLHMIFKNGSFSTDQANRTDSFFQFDAQSGMPRNDVQSVPDLGIENSGQFLARLGKVEVSLSLLGQSGHQVLVVACAKPDRTD